MDQTDRSQQNILNYLDILNILLGFVNQQLIIQIAKHKSYNIKKCELDRQIIAIRTELRIQ